MAGFAATGPCRLVRIVERGLKKIQYRPQPKGMPDQDRSGHRTPVTDER
ncbi:hypothetical protein [Actinomadura formosensis]|nr:hypothetical protein [Actinomadura formosensis]